MTDGSTAMLARVLEAVDRRAGEIVEFAGEFIRQPSVNPDLDPASGGEQRAQRWLRDRLREGGGFEIDEWAAVPTRPNVVARRAGSGGGRSLIWCGHTDVVPVSPEQATAWSGPGPFSGKVQDGKLWGRGASDMKGAIAAYVMATRVLHDEGVRLQGDLTLAQVCGEESGRKDIGCNTVLERGHRADLAIFPEPSNFAVYPTIKGEIYFTLTVQGKSTHIANRNLVVQALPHGTERPGVSAIDNMLKYQLALLELERQWLLWRSSPNVPPGGMFVSVNSIQAGPADSPVPTSAVPDSCTATGSMLFYPELTGEEVIAEVRAVIDRVTAGDAWLREHPPTLEIPSGHPMKEPVNLPHDHPGVLTILEANEAVTGETPETRTSPFVCDANYWYPLGQPSLVFGPGDPSWGIHGTNEFLPVEDLIKAVKVFAALTMAWCGVEE